MLALGVYSGSGVAGAAVADEGRLVSAVSVGSGTIPGLSDDERLATVTECLAAAGTDVAHVGRIVWVDSGRSARRAAGSWLREGGVGVSADGICWIPADVAHASLLRGVGGGRRLGLVLCADGNGARGSWMDVCDRRGGRIEPIAWASDVHRAVASTVTALGGPRTAGIAYLEDVASQQPPAAASWREPLFTHDGCGALACDRLALGRRIDLARTESVGPLHVDSPHVAVRRARAALADDVLCDLARAVASACERRISEAGAEYLVSGGAFLESSEFHARLHVLTGRAAFASTNAGDAACALGAALHGFQQVAPIESLALGSSFDEQQVKTALENCRLEYVYEPDWSRLLSLVSGLLSTGAFVAWFQGACDYGTVSHGSRSVLADPSRPYARDNIRTYLLRQEGTSAIPVALADGGADDGRRSAVTQRIRVLGDLANSQALASAADPLGRIKVTPAREPALSRLVELHYHRTGVPGLVMLPLRGTRTALAGTPADAIAAVFTSAVDVAVLGRFVVAKDYWSLRRS